MEMTRDAKPWKLPASLDRYKSVYKKDYSWHEDYHSPIQAHTMLPASLDGYRSIYQKDHSWHEDYHSPTQAHALLPAPRDTYKSIYQKDYCWSEDYHSPIQAHVPKPTFPTFGDLPKCYLPECQPSDLSPRWGRKLEILAEPMHDLSCCSPLPAPAPTAGAEGVLVPREVPSANVLTYQQHVQDLYRDRLCEADRNKTKALSSSILMNDFSDLDWKSIYKQDYEGRKGIFSGIYTEDIRPSPVFPEDNRFNQSRWVTEYADSYSMYLKRLDWSSPISGQWLPFGKDARWTPRWRECTR